MIQKLEMMVLIDNVAEAPLASEWGLSILIRVVTRLSTSEFLTRETEMYEI